MFRLSTASALSLIAFPFWVSTAAAQVTLLPDTVISANQSPQPSERVGASVTVLQGDKLRADGIPTVAEALRNVPGLSVTASGPRGSLTNAFMRGADPRNTLVLIDGIEVNQLGFPGFDFADMPTDDIERVEIIRGPQSGIYGANANAGVISIITRSGRGLKGIRGEGKAEIGSFLTRSGAANIRGSEGPVYASITLSDYATRGYNIARLGNEKDGSRALVATSKFGVDFTPNFNVEGVLRFTDRRAYNDSQDFNFPFGPNYGLIVDTFAYNDYRNLAGRATATLTLWEGRWVQSAGVKFSDEKTGSLDAFIGAFGANGLRVTTEYKSGFFFSSNLFGGESHGLTFLLDNRREDYAQDGNPARFIKERKGLAGEYVLDLPTHLTLSAAVRHDWNSAFEDVTTWRYALSQRIPMAGSRIHASYGKGITDPDVFQLFGSPFNLANPNLVNEQSLGWDVGIEQQWLGRRLVTDVTYFSTRFTDKIDLVFSPGMGGLVYVNGTGIAERKGVEIAATANWAPWISTTAIYTWLEATDSFGSPEIRRPPHAGGVETTIRWSDNRARATFGVNYNGTRKDFFFQPLGNVLVNLPGAWVARAIVSYDMNPNTTIFARAENLFDSRYEEIYSYRMPGAAGYIGLRVKFGDRVQAIN